MEGGAGDVNHELGLDQGGIQPTAYSASWRFSTACRAKGFTCYRVSCPRYRFLPSTVRAIWFSARPKTSVLDFVVAQAEAQRSPWMTWFSQFLSQDVSEQFLSQDLSPPATRSLASTDFPVGLEQLVFEDEQGHSVTRCSPPSSPLKRSRASMLYFPWMEMVNCPGTSMACLTLAFLWMLKGTESL